MRTRSRARAILIATLLCLVALLPQATPVGASARRPQAPERVQTGAPNNCQSSTDSVGWVGDDAGGAPTNDIYGVEAAITPRIDDCLDTNGLDLLASASVWISVGGPVDTHSGCDSGLIRYLNCRIIQMGVIACDATNDPADSPCRNGLTSTPRYFYAWGRGDSEPGCPYGAHIPRPVDLGPAVLGATHSYKIRLLNGQWTFKIDNVLVRQQTDTLCWATNSSLANFASHYGERHDGADSVGTSSTSASAFGGTSIDLYNPVPPVTGNTGTWVTHHYNGCSASGDQASEQKCSWSLPLNDTMWVWDILT
jgi:hypothetical protein